MIKGGAHPIISGTRELMKQYDAKQKYFSKTEITNEKSSEKNSETLIENICENTARVGIANIGNEQFSKFRSKPLPGY